MFKTLAPHDLTINIDPKVLGFTSTAALVGQGQTGWIGQSEAEAAARFGLGIHHPGFHLIVIGEPGCGRTSLMLKLMHEYAAKLPVPRDMVYLHNFENPDKPMALRLPAGRGVLLRQAMDQFIRILLKTMPSIVQDAVAVEAMLEQAFAEIKAQIKIENGELHKFESYLIALRQDIFDSLEVFQQANTPTAPPSSEQIISLDNDGMLESYLVRFRVNLIVDHRQQTSAPVIYDDDPTFQSLFGSFESGSEQSSNLPEFLRLRAGNLMRADGGMLMLHLRDIHNDHQNGPQILEKLHRFLRNGRVQIEESVSHAGQTSVTHAASDPVPVQVRLVLVATRQEFYQLQDEAEEFAHFFNVKVDFSDDFPANTHSYQALARYIADRCEHFALPHFSAEAVATVLTTMHRWVEDKAYISSRLASLQQLILASAAQAKENQSKQQTGDNQVFLVEKSDVNAVLQASYKRHRSPEMQLLRSIVDGDLMIRLQGHAVGQINGLTHIDLGDAGFGSPVRISARCFAGEDGVINIDREVEMTGPNHDKGLFILQSWLSASFAALTPLSLNASLVFEQEYHGVEGDSASCAELYALLSAISGLPLPQGLAVTGAMNQHGEVMAIGGVNEKIEGYFRVCQAVGLDGTQGVLIPERNASHLLLNDEVIDAVCAGKFHIHTFQHVLEGAAYLIGLNAGELDTDWRYPANSVMGRVQETLERFRKIYDSNKSDE
jgi:predicted ATP-dependent protease